MPETQCKLRCTDHPWYQFPALEYDRTPPCARADGSEVEARARRAANANILVELEEVTVVLQNEEACPSLLYVHPPPAPCPLLHPWDEGGPKADNLRGRDKSWHNDELRVAGVCTFRRLRSSSSRQKSAQPIHRCAPTDLPLVLCGLLDRNPA